MRKLVTNKKAHFEFAFEQHFTAGLQLTGAEVKAVKLGQASLAGAYVSLRAGEAFLVHSHISPYKYAGGEQAKKYNPERDRKLLLNKREISSLVGKSKGTVIIPIEIIEDARSKKVKLIIGVGRGKKKFDKRETIKKREISRRIQRGEEY